MAMKRKRNLPKGISYREERNDYMGRFRYDGENYCVYGKTVDETLKKLNDRRYEVTHDMYFKETEVTVNSWFLTWIKEYKRMEVKKGTIINYTETYKSYIEKKLGKRKLKDIRPDQIQHLFNEMAEQYAKQTIKLVKAVLNGMYRQAIINRLVRDNPVSVTRIPKTKTKEKKKAMTQEEQEIFMKYAEGTICENIISFALGTGMRIGEIRALQWQDVDFNEKIIRVRHTLKTSKGEGYWLDTAKSESSVREIFMLERIYYLLKEEKREQNKRKLRAGIYWQPDEGLENLVFTTDEGRPYSHSKVNTEIKKIQERMTEDGIIMFKITPHIFRHTFATRALENGLPVKAVQEFLGHSSSAITLDTYSHVSNKWKREEMKKMENII